MKSSFAKRLMLAAAFAVFFAAPSAWACPMCKAANESPQLDGTAAAGANLRPRAYMYSIFFMMSMPPIAAGIIGTAIYRDVKRTRVRAN